MTANEKKKADSGTVKRTFRLEAERGARGMNLVACPIVGIEKFSDTEICVKGHGGKITVCGKRLSVTLLEGGAVEIIGKVADIHFGYGKN